MDAQKVTKFLSSLPHVVKTASNTTRWGDKVVFRVGDQAEGGRMFAQIGIEQDGRAILSFATDPGQFRELIEKDGLIPAPYRARLYWVALMQWDALGASELKELLRNARALTFAKMPKYMRELMLRSK
jgi:predicted DNA-binding protein (MmcQ/YjbR family)